MSAITTWQSLENLDLCYSGMLLFLILELTKHMFCNLGINSLKTVIFLMVMKSHSTTGIMNKFGKLLLEVKRIGTTVIVTKLSLGCLFYLLTLP